MVLLLMKTTVYKIRPKPIRGLGDVVHFIVQPVVSAIDAMAGTNLKNCAGCETRREILNEIRFAKSLKI